MSEKMTPGLRAWLTRLATDGPAHRARGNIGRRAMIAGWTDWLMIYKPTGEQVLWHEHHKQNPTATMADYDGTGDLEAITAAGRAALAEDKREGGE